MIWSATPFFNELDILELRLQTLEGVVDRHVLVEATHNQVGNRKPLYFDRERFAAWPIEYIVVDDMPFGSDPWQREHFQRDVCMRGMGDLAVDDLVFISDLDEIPDSRLFLDPPQLQGGPVQVLMSMHLYYLNWRWREVPVAGGTRACFVNGAMLRESKATALCEAPWHRLEGTNGWHLSYQGGIKRIQQKLAALADFKSGALADRWQERWASREHLAECLATGRDLFDRAYRQCEWVGLDELPPVVRQDPKRWSHMLIEEPA